MHQGPLSGQNPVDNTPSMPSLSDLEEHTDRAGDVTMNTVNDFLPSLRLSLPPATDRGGSVQTTQVAGVAQVRHHLARSIEIHAPLTRVFWRWIRFDDLPHFMRGVDEFRKPDKSRPVWIIEVGGARIPWEAEVCDQNPSHRIAWRSKPSCPFPNRGSVRFAPERQDTTRVTVRIEFDSRNERAAILATLNALGSRVEKSCNRFRDTFGSCLAAGSRCGQATTRPSHRRQNIPPARSP